MELVVSSSWSDTGYLCHNLTPDMESCTSLRTRDAVRCWPRAVVRGRKRDEVVTWQQHCGSSTSTVWSVMTLNKTSACSLRCLYVVKTTWRNVEVTGACGHNSTASLSQRRYTKTFNGRQTTFLTYIISRCVITWPRPSNVLTCLRRYRQTMLKLLDYFVYYYNCLLYYNGAAVSAARCYT